MVWVSQLLQVLTWHKPHLEKSEEALAEFQTHSNHVFQLMPLYFARKLFKVPRQRHWHTSPQARAAVEHLSCTADFYFKKSSSKRVWFTFI